MAESARRLLLKVSVACVEIIFYYPRHFYKVCAKNNLRTATHRSVSERRRRTSRRQKELVRARRHHGAGMTLKVMPMSGNFWLLFVPEK